MKDFFVSFNSADRAWADWIAWTLEEAGFQVVYQPWDFRPGSNFVLEMQRAASEARKTVVVLSDNYLRADYTQPEWAAAFVQDPRGEHRTLIPLRVAPCSPTGLLKSLIYADLVDLPADAARAAVLTAVSDSRSKPVQPPAFPGTPPHLSPAPAYYPGGPMPTTPTLGAVNPQSRALALWNEKLAFLKEQETLAVDAAQKFALKKQIEEAREKLRGLAGRPVLDLGRLPIPGPYFVGREAELARLDAAWEDPAIHVLTLVAFGGIGKSALVSHWLDRMAADGWRGATRVLDWSFYSQGMENRVTSAEPFIDHALRFFGDPDSKTGSLHNRGARLASLVREERSLLVLDGIEPLQYSPGRPEVEGRLKDPGLAALLKGLAAGNPGLCVVTTRGRIADLAGSPRTAPQILLEELEPGAAVDLLRQLGVDGRESEMRAVAEEFQRHALTLTLLGNFLRRAHDGDIRKWREIDFHRADEKQGGHASRVIAAYARWLGEGPELAILRLIGLFDHPAEAGALTALRAAPPIPGLTEPLVGLSEEDWNLAAATLRDHSLLAAADPREPKTLDAHPLVRASFADELESHRPDAWQEGNRRLYEYLRQAAPDLPDTLEAMQPLYAAVVHGCRAGRQQEAMDEIYWRRILRGKEHFSWHKLGAFGSELAALAGFFDRPWSEPSTRLIAAAQAFVLSQAAVALRALGLLAEAVEPAQVALEACTAQENWKETASSANYLSELTLTLGEIPRAVAFGEQSVELADRSGDAFRRMAFRTTWADALHQAGRWEESAAAFRVAEALQAEGQPEYPRLYSLWGFRYCELLLGWAEPEAGSGLGGLTEPGSRADEAERFRQACREVLERGQEALAIILKGSRDLLDIALGHLTLGRAYLGLALTEDRIVGLAQAAEQLDRAINGLRQAAAEEFVFRGLLARAALLRFRSDFSGAATDLTAALEIAERGPMRLHECDAHLEWARLHWNQGDLATARLHIALARELVNETGYGRRAREVEWLERASSGV